jgi:rod shape-determining protein MreD
VRTATVVLVAYVLCVIVASVWRFMPGLAHDAIPDLGALTAAYLGHTARNLHAPPTAGAVVIGYLIDVISGSPVGLSSVNLAFTMAIARGTQQRILVRGIAMTIGFSAFVAIVASVNSLFLRMVFGVPSAGLAVELQHLALVTIATAIVGPLVWRLFRRIDAAFARTHRERDAALEGLVP